MRILRRGMCALLALAMVAAMIPPVVVRADEPESTLPVETTLPAETTVPVETTLPADTTAEATEPQFTVQTEPTEVPEQTLPAETAAPTEETVCLSEEDPRPIPTEVTLTELDDADRLYNDYLMSLFYPEEMLTTQAGYAREQLNDVQKYVYDESEKVVLDIVAGKRTTVSFKIPFRTINAKVSQFTEEELRMTMRVLQYDHPAEMFWYGGYAYIFQSSTNELWLWIKPRAQYLPANFSWYDNPTVVVTQMQKAVKAVKNAESVVEEFASYPDYWKLTAYADRISELVEYDYDALAEGYWETDINPSTLVNIFDGDPETNVVCNGYAQGYQYLCDQSEFREDVKCYKVGNGNPSINHAWNIIRINGKGYLMDVTHCDIGDYARRSEKFMGYGPGPLTSGYVLDNFRYWYDEEMEEIWGFGEDSILVLATTPLDPADYAEHMTQAELEAALRSCGGSYTLRKFVTIDSDLSLEGIRLTIEPGGRLTVASGAMLRIPENASVRMNYGAEIQIREDAAVLCYGDFQRGKGFVTGDGLLYITHGSCGPKATWTYDEDSATLIISGTGSMDDYADVSDTPWYQLAGSGKIWKVIVQEGITRIGKRAFYQMNCIQTVTLPSTLKEIGAEAFFQCGKLRDPELPDGLKVIDRRAFWNCNGIAALVVPASVTTIGEEAFSYCYTLDHITFRGNAPEFVRKDGSSEYNHFKSVEATVCYPAGNGTWTGTVRQNYGGTLTWKAGCAGQHREVITPGVAPTCTSSGWTEGRTCSVCGVVLAVRKYIPQVNHIEITDWPVAPDCTQNGLTEGKHCAICNKVLIAQRVVAALGHTEVVDTAVAPTCTTTGLTKGKHCGRCSKVLAAQSVVGALGHNEVADRAVAPDCTNTGLTEGKHCDRCNEVLVAQTVVDALGHREVIDAAVAPICTETGLTEGKHCSVCHEVLTAQEVIPALGHSTVTDGSYASCTRCGGEIYLRIARNQITLKPGQSYQLSIEVFPADLADDIIITPAPGSGKVASVAKDGTVTTWAEGTAIVEISVTGLDVTLSERCRIDVLNPVSITGIQLSADKLTAELFSAAYAEFELLMKREQSSDASSAAAFVEDPDESMVIEEICFTNGAAARMFELVARDDRTVMIVPTEYAMKHPRELQNSYSSSVTAVIQGEKKFSQMMTLTVKKTTPKLSVSVPAFNSFYGEQSQPITVTGATVTGIRLDPDKVQPDWLTLEDGILTMPKDAPRKSVSGKVNLLVDTAEWRIPTAVALTVKNVYKEPVLKFSTKSISLNTAAMDSAAITVTATPADYDLSGLTLRLTDSKGNELPLEELNIREEQGIIRVGPAEQASGNYKLYVSTNGSKETVVAIKTIHAVPTVTFRVNGGPDLSIPEQYAQIIPTFRNYGGSFTVETMTAETAKKQDVSGQFRYEQEGGTIRVFCESDTLSGSYTLKLKLKLANGAIVENTVRISVKRTPLKVKLSAAKLTLNKLIGDQAAVAVTSATKGYTLQTPYWELKDKTGKTGAEGELTIQPEGNVLHIAVNDSTKYGATYKLLVKADQTSAAQTLTITVPAENKSSVTSVLKAKGGIDVIRDSSAVTLTPTYQNCSAEAEKKAELVFYKTVGRTSEEVEGLFAYTANADGSFTVTKRPGAKLDHSGKYTVKLVAEINGKTTTESKPVALSVKMGTAKLTLTAKDSVLFAKDAHDRLEFRIDSGDKTLNGIEKLTVKDKKYVDLLEVYDYGNGTFAVGFRNAGAAASLAGKNITVNLDVLLKGNVPAKVNATLRLKVTVLP